MDKEWFINYIRRLLFNREGVDTEDWIYCNDISNEFYEDFCESYNIKFGNHDFRWNEDLAKRIVEEELAAMEYE